MLKIAIPTPCHQEWNDMETRHDGRFCNACAKTVVDFTGMNDEDVKNFLLNKRQEKVCGRFTNTQLNRITIKFPENILVIPMPLWKKFLTASLIIFSTTLFSCDTNYDDLKGKPPSFDNISAEPGTISVKNDTAFVVAGEVETRDTVPVIIKCPRTMGIVAPPVEELMGEVAMKPQKTDTTQALMGTAVVVNPKYVKGDIKREEPKIDTPKVARDTIIMMGKLTVPDSCSHKKYQ